MPELPEVETTKRGLCEAALGATIVSVKVSKYHLRYPIPQDLAKRITGQILKAIVRRGKYLILVFEDSDVPFLLVHLGMSGWFCAMTEEKADLPVHSHVTFKLNNNIQLVYNDSRRFGVVDWCRREPDDDAIIDPEGKDWAKDYRLQKMGVEPLEEEFTADYLWSKAKHRKITLKQFLMDNAVVVGIGNIYAAEILFQCGLHPETQTSDLEEDQWPVVIEKTREVLQTAIAAKGTTFRDFVHGNGRVGDYQKKLYVYGRRKQPCLVCANILCTIKQNGRSTFYCDHCQSPRKRVKPETDVAP